MATLTINGVSCEIYWGEDGQSDGIQESWPEEGPQVTVYYKCLWSDRYPLMQGLRGGYYAGANVWPHAYPPSPNLYCRSIGQVRGVKAKMADGFAAYKWAIVPANYGVPTWNLQAGDPSDSQKDPSGKELSRTRFRTSVEVMVPPSGAFYWEAGPDDGKKIPDTGMGYMRSKIEINYTKLWVPRVRLGNMVAYSGTVNVAPVKIADHTFPKGTLLFMAANTDATEDSLDGMTFSEEYVLVGQGPVIDGSGDAYTPEWNEFMARDASWQFINTAADATGDRPYRYSDFWDYI